MLTSTFLTDAEIDEACDPLQQPAAQVRYLRSLGLLVGRKPNGRPLVARSEVERARVSGAEVKRDDNAPQPDYAALAALLKRGRNGTQAKRQ